MCGRCTKSVAGTFSQLVTVSESNMRISFPSQQLPVFGMQTDNRKSSDISHKYNSFIFLVHPV